jgi:hypothetical protein
MYKRRSNPIEAIQYTGHNGEKLNDWSAGRIIERMTNDSDVIYGNRYLECMTIYGIVTAEVGDYIIKTEYNTFKPVQTAKFDEEYELMEND